MKERARRLMIWLHLIPKGCIATTTRGQRCTRKAYPYCKAHDKAAAFERVHQGPAFAYPTASPEPETGAFVG